MYRVFYSLVGLPNREGKSFPWPVGFSIDWQHSRLEIFSYLLDMNCFQLIGRVILLKCSVVDLKGICIGLICRSFNWLVGFPDRKEGLFHWYVGFSNDSQSSGLAMYGYLLDMYCFWLIDRVTDLKSLVIGLIYRVFNWLEGLWNRESGLVLWSSGIDLIGKVLGL